MECYIVLVTAITLVAPFSLRRFGGQYVATKIALTVFRSICGLVIAHIKYDNERQRTTMGFISE